MRQPSTTSKEGALGVLGCRFVGFPCDGRPLCPKGKEWDKAAEQIDFVCSMEVHKSDWWVSFGMVGVL